MAQEQVSEQGSGIGGNHYDKYASQNPIERRLMDGFLSSLDELVELSDTSQGHEIGCGEGELTRRLAASGMEMRGSDISPSVVEQAIARTKLTGQKIPYKAASLFDLHQSTDSAELVVCCEVLEHLGDPEAALAKLASLTQEYLIVSVPREPIWRIMNMGRLAYVSSFGNTPGHINHWSKKGFTSFLEDQVSIVKVRSPFPWTMALCEPKK